jgi:hypothetical protein
LTRRAKQEHDVIIAVCVSGVRTVSRTPSLADAEKQSSLPPRKDSGLLRCARNDDAAAGEKTA